MWLKMHYTYFEVNQMRLSNYTQKLYRATGKLNLYLCLACKNKLPDAVRIKKDIEEIKRIISEIEDMIIVLKM